MKSFAPVPNRTLTEFLTVWSPHGLCNVGRDAIEIIDIPMVHCAGLIKAKESYGHSHGLFCCVPDDNYDGFEAWPHPLFVILHAYKQPIVELDNSFYLQRGKFEMQDNAGWLVVYQRMMLSRDWDPRLGRRHHQAGSIEEYHNLTHMK